jgi:catechol 2,3-dioxygenase-like lactoylglutathione lyase family enzyme
MSKLATVVLFTPQIDRMKTFYGDQLGFPVRNDTPDWTEYDTEGATLALHRMPDPERRGVEFRLLVPDVEERMRELGQRGVRFAGNAQKIPGRWPGCGIRREPRSGWCRS